MHKLEHPHLENTRFTEWAHYHMVAANLFPCKRLAGRNGNALHPSFPVFLSLCNFFLFFFFFLLKDIMGLLKKRFYILRWVYYKYFIELFKLEFHGLKVNEYEFQKKERLLMWWDEVSKYKMWIVNALI